MALPPTGYCKHCHWLIPLDFRGKLERHTPPSLAYKISQGTASATTACRGSRTMPPAETPTEVDSLAFADTPPVTRCPACRAPDVVIRSDGLLSAHTRPNSVWGEMCRGSYRPAPKTPAS